MKLKNKLKLISRDIFLYTLISLFIISCGNGCKYPGEDENWVETRGVELYPINLDFLNVADEGHVYLKEGATEEDAKKNLWKSTRVMRPDSSGGIFSMFTNMISGSSEETTTENDLILNKGDVVQVLAEGAVYLAGSPRNLSIKTKSIDIADNGFYYNTNSELIEYKNSKKGLIPPVFFRYLVRPGDSFYVSVSMADYQRDRGNIFNTNASLDGIDNNSTVEGVMSRVSRISDNYPLVKSVGSDKYIPLKNGNGLVIEILPNPNDDNSSMYSNPDLWSCNLGPTGSYDAHKESQLLTNYAVCASPRYIWNSYYEFKYEQQPGIGDDDYQLVNYHRFDLSTIKNFLNSDILNNFQLNDNINNWEEDFSSGNDIFTRYGPFAGFKTQENLSLIHPFYGVSNVKDLGASSFDFSADAIFYGKADNEGRIERWEVASNAGGDRLDFNQYSWLKGYSSETGKKRNIVDNAPYFLTRTGKSNRDIAGDQRDGPKNFSPYTDTSELEKNIFADYTELQDILKTDWDYSNDTAIGMSYHKNSFIKSSNFARCTINWKKYKWMLLRDGYRFLDSKIVEFEDNESAVSSFFPTDASVTDIQNNYNMKNVGAQYGGMIRSAKYDSKGNYQLFFHPEFTAKYKKQLIYLKTINSDPINASGSCLVKMNVNQSLSEAKSMNMNYPFRSSAVGGIGEGADVFSAGRQFEALRYAISSGLISQKWTKFKKVIEKDANISFTSSGTFNSLGGLNRSTKYKCTGSWPGTPSYKEKSCGLGIAFKVVPLPNLICKKGYRMHCNNPRVDNYIQSLVKSDISIADNLIGQSCEEKNGDNIKMGTCKIKKSTYLLSNLNNIIGEEYLNQKYDSVANLYKINKLVEINASNEWDDKENVLENQCGLCVKKNNITSIDGTKYLLINKNDDDIKNLISQYPEIKNSTECQNHKSENLTWIKEFRYIAIESSSTYKNDIKNLFISKLNELINTYNINQVSLSNFNLFMNQNILSLTMLNRYMYNKKYNDITESSSITDIKFIKEKESIDTLMQDIFYAANYNFESLCEKKALTLYQNFFQVISTDNDGLKKLNVDKKFLDDLEESIKIISSNESGGICTHLKQSNSVNTGDIYEYEFYPNYQEGRCMDDKSNSEVVNFKDFSSNSLVSLKSLNCLHQDLYINLGDICPAGYTDTNETIVTNLNDPPRKVINQECSNEEEQVGEREIIPSFIKEFDNIPCNTLQPDEDGFTYIEDHISYEVKDSETKISKGAFHVMAIPDKLLGIDRYNLTENNPPYIAKGSWIKNFVANPLAHICCSKKVCVPFNSGLEKDLVVCNSSICCLKDTMENESNLNPRNICYMTNTTNNYNPKYYICNPRSSNGYPSGLFNASAAGSDDNTYDGVYGWIDTTPSIKRIYNCRMPEKVIRYCGISNPGQKKICRKCVQEDQNSTGELVDISKKSSSGNIKIDIPRIIDGKKFTSANLMAYFAPPANQVSKNPLSDLEDMYGQFKMDTFEDMQRGYKITISNGMQSSRGKYLFFYFQPLDSSGKPNPDYHPDVFFANKSVVDIINSKRPKVYHFHDFANQGSATFSSPETGKMWFAILDPVKLDSNGINQYSGTDGKIINFVPGNTIVKTEASYRDFNVGKYLLNVKVQYQSRTSDNVLASVLSSGGKKIVELLINPLRAIIFGDWDEEASKYKWESGLIYKVTTFITKQYFVQLLHIVLISLFMFIYGLKILFGQQSLSIQEIWDKAFRFAMVAMFTSPTLWTWYQYYVVGFAISTAEGLAQISAGTFATSILDLNEVKVSHAIDPGFGPMSEVLNIIFNTATFERLIAIIFSSLLGIFTAFVILLSFLGYILAAAKALILYFLHLLSLAIYFAIGPLIFLMFIFDETKDAFEKWWKGIASSIAYQVSMFIGLAIFSIIYVNMLKGIFNFTMCMETIIKIPIINLTLLKAWRIAGDLPVEFMPYLGSAKSPNVDAVSIFTAIKLYIIIFIMEKFVSEIGDIAGSIFGVESPLSDAANIVKGSIDQIKGKASLQGVVGSIGESLYKKATESKNEEKETDNKSEKTKPKPKSKSNSKSNDKSKK